MSEVIVRGTRIHYEDSGGDGDVVLFSHGLLWNSHLYDAQVEALRDRYRCVRYDHRGQGQSEVPAEGDEVSIEDCAADAVALIETLGLPPVHFVGLSMGGFVGMRVGARRPELLRSLTLMDTAADPEPRKNVPKYTVLNFLARSVGVRFVTASVAPILFGRTFLTDPRLAVAREAAIEHIASNRRTIYKAVNGVIRRSSFEDRIRDVRVPTCILHGEEDVAITMERALRLRSLLPSARFATVPAAGHSAPVENPEAVTSALLDFLGSLA